MKTIQITGALLLCLLLTLGSTFAGTGSSIGGGKASIVDTARFLLEKKKVEDDFKEIFQISSVLLDEIGSSLTDEIRGILLPQIQFPCSDALTGKTKATYQLRTRKTDLPAGFCDYFEKLMSIEGTHEDLAVAGDRESKIAVTRFDLPGGFTKTFVNIDQWNSLENEMSYEEAELIRTTTVLHELLVTYGYERNLDYSRSLPYARAVNDFRFKGTPVELGDTRRVLLGTYDLKISDLDLSRFDLPVYTIRNVGLMLRMYSILYHLDFNYSDEQESFVCGKISRTVSWPENLEPKWWRPARRDNLTPENVIIEESAWPTTVQEENWTSSGQYLSSKSGNIFNSQEFLRVFVKAEPAYQPGTIAPCDTLKVDFRATTEALTDETGRMAVFKVDREKRIIRVNFAAYNALGSSEKEIESVHAYFELLGLESSQDYRYSRPLILGDQQRTYVREDGSTKLEWSLSQEFVQELLAKLQSIK